MLFSSRKTQMIEPDRALRGRDEPMPVPARHDVIGTPLMPPFPEGLPSYEEVCSTATGHAEVVLAVFDPNVTSYEAMLQLFWENHDPTQGMRQGNDVGTQYRSAIYATDDQLPLDKASVERYQPMPTWHSS